MAIIDAQLAPSTNQSLAGAAAATLSTNTIDLLSANVNLGVGAQRRAIAIASTAFTGGTSVQVELISSASANLSSPTVLATGAVVVTANATIGAILFNQFVPNTAQRYIGFRYTTVGTTTTGAITSFIGSEIDQQPYYPSNTGF